MAGPSHNRYCPTDPYSPRPVGIDDRSGFRMYLDDLPWQFDYRGNKLANLRIRTSIQDEPQQQLRPIIVGPDPVPPHDPRPDSYATDALGGQPPIQTGGVHLLFTAYLPQVFFLTTSAGAPIVTTTGREIMTTP